MGADELVKEKRTDILRLAAQHGVRAMCACLDRWRAARPARIVTSTCWLNSSRAVPYWTVSG